MTGSPEISLFSGGDDSVGQQLERALMERYPRAGNPRAARFSA